MKISTPLLFQRAISQMQEGQSRVASLQEKVAAGKAVVRPSDSPDETTTITRLNHKLTQLESYNETLAAAKNRLLLEETHITRATEVVIRLKQLAVEGAGIMNGGDRGSIAAEAEELTEELATIGNATDASGRYIFGGSRVNSPPFVIDDSGTVLAPVTASTAGAPRVSDTFTVTISGMAGRGDLITFDGTEVKLERDDGIKEIAAKLGEREFTNYASVDNGDGTVTFTARATGVKSESQRALVVSNNGALHYFGDTTKNRVAFSSGREDTIGRHGLEVFSSVILNDGGVSKKMGFFEELQQFVKDLRADDGSALTQHIGNMDMLFNTVSEALAGVGADSNSVDNQEAVNDAISVQINTIKSRVEQLDMAEAITEMQRELMSVEAAQATFSKVTGLNLFDYIR